MPVRVLLQLQQLAFLAACAPQLAAFHLASPAVVAPHLARLGVPKGSPPEHYIKWALGVALITQVVALVLLRPRADNQAANWVVLAGMQLSLQATHAAAAAAGLVHKLDHDMAVAAGAVSCGMCLVGYLMASSAPPPEHAPRLLGDKTRALTLFFAAVFAIPSTLMMSDPAAAMSFAEWEDVFAEHVDKGAARKAVAAVYLVIVDMCVATFWFGIALVVVSGRDNVLALGNVAVGQVLSGLAGHNLLEQTQSLGGVPKWREQVTGGRMAHAVLAGIALLGALVSFLSRRLSPGSPATLGAAAVGKKSKKKGE